jgi:SmpA / OmlA family
MRYLYTPIAIILVVFTVWFIAPRFLFGGGVVAKGVTAAKIRQIQLGMNKATVVAILGQPFFIESKDPQYYGTNAFVMRHEATSGPPNKSLQPTHCGTAAKFRRSAALRD